MCGVPNEFCALIRERAFHDFARLLVAHALHLVTCKRAVVRLAFRSVPGLLQLPLPANRVTDICGDRTPLLLVVDSPHQVFVRLVVRVNVIVRARNPVIMQCPIRRSKTPFFVRMPVTHLESSESYIGVCVLGFLGDSPLDCIQHGLTDTGILHHVGHFDLLLRADRHDDGVGVGHIHGPSRWPQSLRPQPWVPVYGSSRHDPAPFKPFVVKRRHVDQIPSEFDTVERRSSQSPTATQVKARQALDPADLPNPALSQVSNHRR